MKKQVQKETCPNYKTSKGQTYDLKPDMVELKLKLLSHLSQTHTYTHTNPREEHFSHKPLKETIEQYNSLWPLFSLTSAKMFSSFPFHSYALCRDPQPLGCRLVPWSVVNWATQQEVSRGQASKTAPLFAAAPQS